MSEAVRRNGDTAKIGSNLRALRRGLKLSQQAFGKQFGGFTMRQIQSYESGETPAPLKLLIALGRAGYALDPIFRGLRPPGTISPAVTAIQDSVTKLAELQQILTKNAAILKSILTKFGTD